MENGDMQDKEGDVLADCRELFSHLSELEVQLAAAVALKNESEEESRETHSGELARCEEEHAQLKERARLLKESSRTTVQQFLARIGPLLQAHQDLKEEFSRVNTAPAEAELKSITCNVNGTCNGNVEEVGGILDLANVTDVETHLVDRPRSACADEAAGEPMASYPPSLGSSRCPLELTVVGSPEEEPSARQDAILAAARALLGQSQRVEEMAAKQAAAEARGRPRFLDANPSTGNLPMYTPRVLPPGMPMPEMEGASAGMFAGAEDRPFCGSSNMRVMRTSSLQPYAMGHLHPGDAWESPLQAPIVSTPTVQAPPMKVLTPSAGLGRPQSTPHYAVAMPQVVQTRVVLPRPVSPRPVHPSQFSHQTAQTPGVSAHAAIVRTSSPMPRSAELVHSVGRVASSPRPGRPPAPSAQVCQTSTLVQQGGRVRSVSPQPSSRIEHGARPAAVVYTQSPSTVEAAHWETAAAATAAPEAAAVSPRLVEVQTRPTELSPRHYRSERSAAAVREVSPGQYQYRSEPAPPARELSPRQYCPEAANPPPRELSPGHYRREAAAPAPPRELSPGNFRREMAAPPQVPSARIVSGSMTPGKYRPKAGSASPGMPAPPSQVIRFSSGPSGTAVTKAHWSAQASAAPAQTAGSVRLKPCFPKRSGSVNLASGGGKSGSTKFWL